MFGGSKFGKQTYIDTLKMMYDLLNKARKDGLMALEADVEEPRKESGLRQEPGFPQKPSRSRFHLRLTPHGHHRHRRLRSRPDA